ncbi:hypothetical protein AHiyo8_55990 [Arthrobacter sp. Hiyo8]|nr:hypothetical protein AHiyo8_55990 [Arthrobacter sp. Hiyo8]
MEDRKLRIAAVGDELLAGLGDPRALGWLGRVLARTPQDSVPVESYSLPCPMEGTEGLAARWLDEAGRRFSNVHENRLVIGLSGRDIEFGVSTARSRLNLANILDGRPKATSKYSSSVHHPRWTRPRTAGSRNSMPHLRTSPPAATTTTSTRSRRYSTTNSGAPTSLRMAAPRAKRATGSWPGSCCTAAGSSG